VNSEIITNGDGSIYHLGLLPEDVADIVITVGDQHRVGKVSQHFDSIEVNKSKREFVTHTGHLEGKRITVISTGIGTDNIDIVINELDALVNYNFIDKKIKDELHTLKIIRLGTSGAIQADIEVDSILSSQYAIGLDNLMNFYSTEKSSEDLCTQFSTLLEPYKINIQPYCYSSKNFLSLPSNVLTGITMTAPGFYGPQNRQIRMPTLWEKELWSQIIDFRYNEFKITNLEMETAGIFGLAHELGHQCMSINAILANRSRKTFSSNPTVTVDRMIQLILHQLIKNEI